MTYFLSLQLALQKLANRAGYIVRPKSYNSDMLIRLLRYLELNQIDTVLDVGANQGQYALDLFEGGFIGKIISFEPIPELHEKLLKLAAKKNFNWEIADQCAISDSNGLAQFNITKSMASSSLLKPSNLVVKKQKMFSVQENIEVPTKTLKDCFEELDITSEKVFLKLDIQGGEEKALIGAQEVLPQIRGLATEMPIRVYYENQLLMGQLDQWIKDKGYDLWDIESAWRDPSSGRLDYIDAVYFLPSE